MGVRHLKRRGKSALIIDFTYRDPQGAKRRYRQMASVQTLTAARAEDARLQRLAAETGSPVAVCQPVVQRKTLSEFIARWRNDWAPRFSPGTLERYEDLLDQGLLDTFGHQRLDQITTAGVYAYESKLLARKIQAWPHISLLSSLLKAAKCLGELDEVPELPRIKKPKRKLRSIPAIDEIEKTVRFATGWLEIAVALAVFAGLRSGELRALLVKHVDFRRAVLHITQAYSGSELKLPKSGTDREVPIDPRLHRVLTEAVKGKRPNDFVVVRASGEPPRRQHVWSALRQLQDKHGLPHRSVHSLRHAFCTFLLQRGADVESVREVAGHEDLRTTAQYLHGNIEQARQAMARLAESDRGSTVDPSLDLN